ncbi:MAG: hypothetical protein JW789_02995 [Candidatus Aenigmarchaeota archaeon]|nr:hypothetical protein [Candidatus Aenigmarchaeota archaeon]
MGIIETLQVIFNDAFVRIMGGIGVLIATTLIQYKFRLVQRVKKLCTFAMNRAVKIGLVITIKTDMKPKDVGTKIGDKWHSEGKRVRIITDSRSAYNLDNGDYVVDIYQLPDKQLGVKTSNIETPIREVDDKFTEIIDLFERLDGIKMDSIGLTALLPFKFELVEIKTTSGIAIEDYDIKLKNDKWKSEIYLKLRDKKSPLMVLHHLECFNR